MHDRGVNLCTHIGRALYLKRVVSVAAAAEYLRATGVDFKIAQRLLLTIKERKHPAPKLLRVV